MRKLCARLSSIALVVPFSVIAASPAPDSWIPARWQGGPLELYQRARAKTLPAGSAAHDAIANWYDASTLGLLEGSPVNCLLVTWSAGADAGLEFRQQQLVKAYTAQAHQRGFAVVGLVYSGADPAVFLPAASDARLDGIALEGEFAHGVADRVVEALAAARPSGVVISIAKTAAAVPSKSRSVWAIEGVSPSARNLADMGIRGAPSSEPWIQSNIWLVRSLRHLPARRPVWVSYQPDGGSASDYARFVADASVAGGRWIVALDDALRTGLRTRDREALAVWQRIGACLRFAEEHADWRTFDPYGALAIIHDPAAPDPEMAEEYLKLVARRQVPYRLIARPELRTESLSGFRAVLATALAPPSDAERKALTSFAEGGGLVVAGPSWGNPPKDEPFQEVAIGKGRVAVYRDPDPESVARDMKELSLAETGMIAFNVPSVITYASTGGKRLLVQLLNYSNSPATAITLRVTGRFQQARLFTPDGAPADLALSGSDGRTDVTIPQLVLWGGLLLE